MAAATTNGVKNAKTILRAEMKKRIASLSKEEKDKQSEAVAKKLINHPVYQKSARVSIYLHMDDEIRTTQILEDIFKSGKKCFIPRYNKDEMAMVQLKSLEEIQNFAKTKWNIFQPGENENRENALETGGLDLVLVPGLAFTLQGGRMGRGKGYYDKFLSKCKAMSPNLSTIALAFDVQVVPEIPMAEYDFRLDYVLSPKD